ncbi:MAG: hypothetical protein EXR94_09105 [Gemmatimonadetes bacterium]|nr:hypothetical protein [Gemmatimonadota bacterium]
MTETRVPNTVSAERRALLLLVDGLRPDVAEAELTAGHLPELARLVGNHGVGRAITAFPSTTSVAYLPFLTGCLPGRCNVPSIRWLDRAAYTGRWWTDRATVRSYCGYQAGMLDQDIAPDVRTIFEIIPESAGFFTPITRGLTPDRDPSQGQRKFWGAVAHYLLWHQRSDRVVAEGVLDWIGRDPAWRFLFAQFPAVDGYTHQSAPDAPRVIEALRRVDTAIGRITRLLRDRNQLDDTLILLVSDHGASPVHTHFDLAVWLRHLGIATLAHPELWHADPAAAVMVAGNGSAMVYARPGQPRDRRWPLAALRAPEAFGFPGDVIDRLVREPAVAFVAAEDEDGAIRLVDQDGEAMLRLAGSGFDYQPVTADPLGTGPITGSDRDWLQLTFDARYPDAGPTLVDHFRSPRTGDLAIVAREGFDFRDRWEVPEHRAGHGSLIRAHMQVPLWANRPLGPVPLRTTDIFATLLDWLGEPLPAVCNGQLVWSAGAGEVAIQAATL